MMTIKTLADRGRTGSGCVLIGHGTADRKPGRQRRRQRRAGNSSGRGEDRKRLQQTKG